jgi:hypothetical protein
MNLKRICGDPVMFDSNVEIPEDSIPAKLVIFSSLSLVIQPYYSP